MTEANKEYLRETHEAYRVYLLEKLIINFALPSDLFWHTFRALFQGDKSQTTVERIVGLWTGKVRKYQKLLRVKAENGGKIPEEYRELCCHTPCGRVRYWLASWREPELVEGMNIQPVNAQDVADDEPVGRRR